MARVTGPPLTPQSLTGDVMLPVPNAAPATASMAKYWCTQKQCEIIDTCLQLHGGAGYMDEYEISRMYADARVQKIYGGTNEIMKELIGRTLG